MKANQILNYRGKSKPRSVKPLSTLRGQYFYLYMFIDVFSRKIVGWRVHERESSDLSSQLLTEICFEANIEKKQLSLHADNGGPMKGAMMLVTMQKLGVVPSFSRPSVSDDNPFSESLFKTLKYCPQYPTKPFDSIEAATVWVTSFVNWYNTVHLHSGIKFVTPSSRRSRQENSRKTICDLRISKKEKSVALVRPNAKLGPRRYSQIKCIERRK